MNGKVIFGILIALALVAGAAGIGVVAYNAGLAQGLAQSGKIEVVAPSAGVAPFPFYAPYFYYRPFGFGFGLLGCLFPLLLIFLGFALLRGLFFWGRPWGWGHYGWHRDPMGRGVPPMFEEWHRRAHGEGGEKPQDTATQQS